MSTLDDSIAATAARQHGAFSRRQVGEAGGHVDAIARRVRSGRWQRLARDVFAVSGSAPTWRRALWAAHLEAGPTSVVARRSAARLFGLPGHESDVIELLVPRGHDHRTSMSALRETADLAPAQITVVDGLPCTTLARCLFDLAGDVPRHLRTDRGREVHRLRIARAVDSALARRSTSIEQLHGVVDALGRRGRPGTALMRQLIDERTEAQAPVESELEAAFLALCRSHGLPAPQPQVTLGGAGGLIGRVDFLFADHALVVEVDGAAFHDAHTDHEGDRRRDNQLAALGLRVLRLRWRDVVHDVPHVVALLDGALGARPGRKAA